MRVHRCGYELLSDPLLNKDTAFSEAERDALQLQGLLPPHVESLDQQAERRLASLRSAQDDLERYAALRELQDTNETLFYALLTRNIESLLPIVYTPTVGRGCQCFSHLYRRPRGLFLSPPHQDRMDRILENSRFDDVQVIVVTDGERILGLGDQGAGGMGIPIGKLSLYTACGGIHPSRTLPIMLDVGTNNKTLLNDPLYIGWRHERLRGQPYDDFIEAFVGAVERRWPHVLLQWEDFSGHDADRLLRRYRDRLCTFNDDIQGTAAVVCGAVFAALESSHQSLSDQTVAMVGAGSAGTGIAALLARSLQEAGVPERETARRFYLLDSKGLLTDDRKGLSEAQAPFAQPRESLSDWRANNAESISLEEVVRHAHPSILIGVSGQPGLFNEAILREMAKHVERPLVFPLSNPTSRSEATPEDIMAWTQGRAVIGTGSPFPPVKVDGREAHIDQINNSYVFPGVGLGAIASRSRRVSESMFLAAARALAAMSPARGNPQDTLLPPLARLRETACRVAVAVASQAHKEGLSDGFGGGSVEQAIARHMWSPEYVEYEKVGRG